MYRVSELPLVGLMARELLEGGKSPIVLLAIAAVGYALCLFPPTAFFFGFTWLFMLLPILVNLAVLTLGWQAVRGTLHRAVLVVPLAWFGVPLGNYLLAHAELERLQAEVAAFNTAQTQAPMTRVQSFTLEPPADSSGEAFAKQFLTEYRVERVYLAAESSAPAREVSIVEAPEPPKSVYTKRPFGPDRLVTYDFVSRPVRNGIERIPGVYMRAMEADRVPREIVVRVAAERKLAGSVEGTITEYEIARGNEIRRVRAGSVTTPGWFPMPVYLCGGSISRCDGQWTFWTLHPLLQAPASPTGVIAQVLGLQPSPIGDRYPLPAGHR